jgi:hypothetical protein
MMDALLHMLGLDADHCVPWRNHYVTGENDPAIMAGIAAGYIEPARSPGFLPAEDRVYRATPAGIEAAITENKRRNPKPSRSKARYLHWINVSDVYWPMKFGEWLRRGLYRRTS